jgi:methionine-rich copper-binding protein CopC
MTDEHIVAYLLEELPEEELERFEDECFAQENWPAQLNLVEEDLIDAYLRGELSPEQRRHFKQNYLTTAARLERVRHAAALLRHVGEYEVAPAAPAAERPAAQTWATRFRAFWGGRAWATPAAVALAALAVVFAVWWLARPSLPPASAELTLNVSRGDRAEGVQAARVKLPRDAAALRISLTLPERSAPAANYRVELENADGEKKTLEVIGRDAQTVSVAIPAAQLPRGQYALKLFSVQTDGTEQRISGSYFFTVE